MEFIYAKTVFMKKKYNTTKYNDSDTANKLTCKVDSGAIIIIALNNAI